jgi:hypothetical protein
MSARLSACYSTAPTGRILVKFDTGAFYESLSRNSQFRYNWTKTLGTLHKDLSTFILLTAVQNILYLDNSVKRTQCCIPRQHWTLLVRTGDVMSTTIQTTGTVAFPWQQWLHERDTMLRYMCTVYVSMNTNLYMRFQALTAVSRLRHSAKWRRIFRGKISIRISHFHLHYTEEFNVPVHTWTCTQRVLVSHPSWVTA